MKKEETDRRGGGVINGHGAISCDDNEGGIWPGERAGPVNVQVERKNGLSMKVMTVCVRPAKSRWVYVPPGKS